MACFVRCSFSMSANRTNPSPPGPKPTGKDGGKPDTPLSGMPLGYVTGPEDLLIDEAGTPLRIDNKWLPLRPGTQLTLQGVSKGMGDPLFPVSGWSGKRSTSAPVGRAPGCASACA